MDDLINIAKIFIYAWITVEAGFLSYYYHLSLQKKWTPSVVRNVQHLFSAVALMFGYATLLPLLRIYYPHVAEYALHLTIFTSIPFALRLYSFRRDGTRKEKI